MGSTTRDTPDDAPGAATSRAPLHSIRNTGWSAGSGRRCVSGASSARRCSSRGSAPRLQRAGRPRPRLLGWSGCCHPRGAPPSRPRVGCRPSGCRPAARPDSATRRPRSGRDVAVRVRPETRPRTRRTGSLENRVISGASRRRCQKAGRRYVAMSADLTRGGSPSAGDGRERTHHRGGQPEDGPGRRGRPD